MVVIYLIMYLLTYGVPLLGTAALAWLLQRFVFRGKSWRWPLAILIAAGLSCVGPLIAWRGFEADLRMYAGDEVVPTLLTLEPGALLHLQEDNHAGVTCTWDCPFDTLEFVTDFHEGDVRRIYVEGADGTPLLARGDLWQALEDPDRSKPFPFRYLFMSASSYVLPKAHAAKYYQPDDWPDNGKGVHMLLEIPPSGVVDFEVDPILYKRFNIQFEEPLPFFWGKATETRQRPQVSEIFTDIATKTSP